MVVKLIFNDNDMTEFVRQLLKKSSGLDESHILYPEKVSSQGTLSLEGLLEIFFSADIPNTNTSHFLGVFLLLPLTGNSSNVVTSD